MAERRGVNATLAYLSRSYDLDGGARVQIRESIEGRRLEERQYVIVEKANRRPVGMARFMVHLYMKRATAADIGLMIGQKEHRGKGYGTEVVQLLLKEAFEQLNLHRVVWWTFPGNTASVALARKMGFKEECRLREQVFFDNKYHDEIVLGLLKNEYEAAKGKASLVSYMPS